MDISDRFKWVDTRGQKVAMDDMRAATEIFATVINELVPDGREKSLAMTKLEESLFWSNRGISVHGVNE